MTIDQCKAIKAKLPKGSRLIIQEATGLTLGYIDKVLNGTRFNKSIFHVSFDIIGNLKEEEQSVEDRFQEIFGPNQ